MSQPSATRPEQARPKARRGDVIRRAVLAGTGIGLFVPVVLGATTIDIVGAHGAIAIMAYCGMMGASIGSVVGVVLGAIVYLALLCGRR
jgi:hypothetical protein